MKCKDNEHCECDGEGVCRNSMTTPQEEWSENKDITDLLIKFDYASYGEMYQATESLIKSEIEKARQEERIETLREVREKIEKIMTIEINPSNDDQRQWYRGLGKEEAQRESRSKVLYLINLLTPTGDK